jgi:hypothetical protein
MFLGFTQGKYKLIKIDYIYIKYIYKLYTGYEFIYSIVMFYRMCNLYV